MAPTLSGTYLLRSSHDLLRRVCTKAQDLNIPGAAAATQGRCDFSLVIEVPFNVILYGVATLNFSYGRHLSASDEDVINLQPQCHHVLFLLC